MNTLELSLANTKLNSQVFACLVFDKHNSNMDIKKMRQERLRLWFSDKSIPEKEKSYISQLINGKASFGEKAARRLEDTYKMPDKYLEGESLADQKGKAYQTTDPQKQRIIEMVFEIGEQDVCDHIENSVRIALGLELIHKQDRRATEDRRHQEEKHHYESVERRALKDRRSSTHQPSSGGGGSTPLRKNPPKHG